jgi:hypothetical protein
MTQIKVLDETFEPSQESSVMQLLDPDMLPDRIIVYYRGHGVFKLCKGRG